MRGTELMFKKASKKKYYIFSGDTQRVGLKQGEFLLGVYNSVNSDVQELQFENDVHWQEKKPCKHLNNKNPQVTYFDKKLFI